MAHKTIKWRCDHCKKTFASKSYAEKQHEPFCFENIKSKSCITCGNFVPFEYDNERHCLVGKNIKFRLKTECQSHKPIES